MSTNRPDQECRIPCEHCEFIDKCAKLGIERAMDAKKNKEDQ